MNNILKTVELYFQYPFVKYALIVGILIALCSSLFGVTLVLKRYSFIGSGLSNVAFGATAAATVSGITNEAFISMPVTIFTAVFLLKRGQKTKVNGEASLAMISTGALAIGYLIINLFSKSANVSADVCSTLFGSTSILTLSESDVFICILMSLVVVAGFLFFYNKIFAVTFDEDFMQSSGVSADKINLLLSVIIAVIIVLAMNLVGSLLVSALIIFPPMSSMKVFKSFRGVVVSSAVISIIAAVFGIIISILWSTPVGAAITAVNIGFYLVFSIIGKAAGRS